MSDQRLVDDCHPRRPRAVSGSGLMRRRLPHGVAFFLSALPLAGSVGAVVETDDREGWFAAAGPVTTIGFTGFPEGTLVTDQYVKLGVVFLEGDDVVICCSYDTFMVDGAGLDGDASIHIAFCEPQRWIAADFPGVLGYSLFVGGTPVFETDGLAHGGLGNFLGLLSTTPFDEVIISPPGGIKVNVDDLHFGGLPVGDLNEDDSVDVSDLLALLAAWGPCPLPCPAQCLGDLDGNEVVGVPDMLALLAAWGPNAGHPADLDLDGTVGVVDLLALLQAFGPCPVLFPPTCAPDLDGDCDIGVTDMLTLLENWG